jgi:hypothetical protein
MKYDIMQDLVIVGGGAFLLLAGVVAKEPINIILSGIFFLFGLAVLSIDVRRNKK